MYNSQDPQSLDTCPYNSSHRILKYRMGTHIVKCRKANQGESTMTVCLFNANHSIPEPELKYHLENCPDRFNLDKAALVTADVDPSKYAIVNVNVPSEDDWDTEIHPTYQPEEYCKERPVLRQTKVASAAVRRDFRTAERHRIQQLKDLQPNETEPGPSRQIGQTLPQTKFRSAALANTTTNVGEEAPYSYEDILRMRDPKPVLANPHFKPTFVRKDDAAKATEIKSPAEDEGAQGFASSSSVISSEGESEEKKNEEFTVQKSKRKIGKGRGRGVNR